MSAGAVRWIAAVAVVGVVLVMRAAMMEAPAPLRVLAAGDSLTEGMVRNGPFHPYSLRLADATGAAVDNAGVSGECVTRPCHQLPTIMRDRVCSLLGAARPPYHVAVVLGGTNDLTVEQPADAIVKGLIEIHECAHRAGTRTLALAVPPRSNRPPKGVAAADTINADLGAWCLAAGSMCRFLDLGTVIDFGRPDLWSDPVHFSSKGYDEVGLAVGRELVDWALA